VFFSLLFSVVSWVLVLVLLLLLLRRALAFKVARLVVNNPARAVIKMRMRRTMKNDKRVADSGRGLML